MNCPSSTSTKFFFYRQGVALFLSSKLMARSKFIYTSLSLSLAFPLSHSFSLSLCLSVCPSLSLSLSSLFICLSYSLCLSDCLSVCLSLCPVDWMLQRWRNLKSLDATCIQFFDRPIKLTLNYIVMFHNFMYSDFFQLSCFGIASVEIIVLYVLSVALQLNN